MTAALGRHTRLACSFYRGGTSKGLLWSTSILAPFAPLVRDRIICHAMGSPDPDKRQIDGLGGGISSLSKTAVVGAPDSKLSKRLQSRGEAFAGVDFADDEQLASRREGGWDLVYRFGQVPVEKATEVDWTSTCGNLVSAVALFGLHEGHVKQARIAEAFQEVVGRQPRLGDGFAFPARLLVACSGQIVRANVPVTLHAVGGETMWWPDLEGDVSISGVPGTAPGILIETPLGEDLLPTGNQSDTVSVDGAEYRVSVINAGLPTIFIASDSLGSVLDPEQLAVLSPAQLDANVALMALLDRLRVAAAQLTPWLSKTLSPSAPKICIVHPTPPQGYSTTGGEKVAKEHMDLLIRAVSVGNLHRTVPATCLSALAAARAFPESTIEQSIHAKTTEGQGGILSIRVGQPAGVSEASVKVRPASAHEQRRGLKSVPESIVYYRTARRIIQGLVDVPPSILQS
ncbi:3-methylitaconate isomerase [Moesziomyces antarcticus]|uniref:3-methylitaconate isomerase n=2 Tax=Pseudozyma antarctica TaxID=84753 RepID=A0A081CL79_PSEA2|nr:3-methylitaconate isomerase [Moesziomyces antarcticus]GAK67425.1 3-methylitaconate isomerase [Moesziomyces antarcticus]SPO48679.1 uncharacterized protein PSANT_06370 [Moesziomyces antarcticus]